MERLSWREELLRDLDAFLEALPSDCYAVFNQKEDVLEMVVFAPGEETTRGGIKKPVPVLVSVLGDSVRTTALRNVSVKNLREVRCT